MTQHMNILFAGGGSLGPVTPLLAIAEALKRRETTSRFMWAGTSRGPERAFVEAAGIPFHSIPVARLPRYVSVEWILFPFMAMTAFARAWVLLYKERPDLVASAGGFTGVPFVFAAWLLGIPSWIHQPDLRPVLSNRLCAPFASLVTVAWPETAVAFPKKKTEVTGQPVRASVQAGNAEAARKRFGFSMDRPVVLVLGGGGGAQWINEAFEEYGKNVLDQADIIHVTGRGKRLAMLAAMGAGYAAVETLEEELADAFAAAEIVVARAGMGTLAELADLRKPAIIVPLPDSLQVDNARAAEARHAVIIVSQEEGKKTLIETVLDLIADKEKQGSLSKEIGTLFASHAVEHVVNLLMDLIH